MRLIAEFTTEPFSAEDVPPAHATKALDIVRAAGLASDFGPLGTSVRGEASEVLAVLHDVLGSVFEHDATRITLQVERDETPQGRG